MKRIWVVAAVLAAGAVYAWTLSTDYRDHRQRTAPAIVVSDTAGSQTSRRRPPALPPSLLVDGEVVEAGTSGNATLVLTVGGVSTSVPIQLPSYSVAVSGAAPDDMVSVEILGEDFKIASILGSYRKLARLAGSDSRLTANELDRVRLSAMSTSLHFFIRRELGMRLPSSDSEHELAIRSVGYEVGIAATALHALSTGNATLPAEYPHGYALLEDGPELRRYLRENPQAIENYEDYMRFASGIPFSQTNLGHRTALLGDLVFGEPHVLNGSTQIVAKTGNGYEMHLSSAAQDPRVEVSLGVEQSVEIAHESPPYFYYYTFRELPPGIVQQVLARSSLIRTAYRRHFVGDLYSLWSQTSHRRLDFPQNPELASEESSSTGIVTAVDLDRISARFWPNEVIGPKAAPYFCVQPDLAEEPALSLCEHAHQQFNADGTGQANDLGSKVDADMLPGTASGSDAFQWRIGSRGTLQLDYPNLSVRYWRLDRGDAATDVVIHLAESGDGAARMTLAGRSAFIDAATPSGFESLSPIGTWRYATFEQQREMFYRYTNLAPVETRFVRASDGSSRQVDTSDENPEYDITYRSGWQLFSGRLYDTRYRANASQPGVHDFPSCKDAFAIGATLCRIHQVRYFRPLARIEDRLYGIEDLYQNMADYGQPVAIVRHSRATYYERTGVAMNELEKSSLHVRRTVTQRP